MGAGNVEEGRDEHGDGCLWIQRREQVKEKEIDIFNDLARGMHRRDAASGHVKDSVEGRQSLGCYGYFAKR